MSRAVGTTSRARRWRRRLLAIGFGVAPFALVELVLALLGLGSGREAEDPFVGFADAPPLFEREAGVWRSSASRRRFFVEESFPDTKPDDEFRIFCVGGSTVQGRPWSVPSAFSTWLRLALETAEPGRKWRTVNCGGISYASYRLAPIVREILDHEPDLIVLCVGHNEFLEAREYPLLGDTPSWVAGPLRWVAGTRTFNVVRDVLGLQPSDERPALPAEVDAMLDHAGGLERYRPDPAWRQGVMAHFGERLDRMVDEALAAGVPVILIDPPANLRDCPPFKSATARELNESARRRYDAARREAADAFRSDPSTAVERLQRALAIDDSDASLHYDLGRCFERSGRLEEARAAWVEAKDRDICPLRILEPMRNSIRGVASRYSVPLLDGQALMAASCRAGIAGARRLADHVHPTIPGHQEIGMALARMLAERGVVQLPGDWDARCAAAFAAHYATLDTVYFARGQRSLEQLRRWAAGRSTYDPERGK